MEKKTPRQSNIVVVTGSRYWENGRSITQRLLKEPDGTLIIEGGAEGVDTLVRYAAWAIGFGHIRVDADWQKHGKAAGPIRNRKMLNMGPRLVIAFHDDLENSRGTKNCVEQAREMGISVEVITK